MRNPIFLLALLATGCVVREVPPPPPVMVSQEPVGMDQQCRAFDTPVDIGGRSQYAHGVACLQPDGTWRIQQQVARATETYIIPRSGYVPYYPPAYVVDPWFYGPPLFYGGVFIGGGWGFDHHHGGFHGSWGQRGWGHRGRR
jgi:hypothetical protein